MDYKPFGNPARIPFIIGGLWLTFSLLLASCEVVAAPQSTQARTSAVAASPADTVVPTQSSIPPTSQASASPPASPGPATTQIPSFPDTAGYQWNSYVTGLNQPVDIQNAGDGSGRLFVVEKPGLIVIFKNGQALPSPFLDIQSKVKSDGSEQGLLGLAFHPKYSQTGLFFVNYIDQDGNTVIARFHVSTSDPDQADPASETDLLHVQQPFPNHNGGSMVFGPDGYLYMGLGDGGSGGDPHGNGQNVQTFLGKILRIDIDAQNNYSIPSTNPFTAGGGVPEIWAYGLRNPWRFSFDKATGDMYIADVGQDAWEEVDFVPAGTAGGLNFGWNYFEGIHAFKGQPPANQKLVQPVAEYSHSEGCSISGGYVYRGPSMPAWQGIYFYGDYCSGNIWGLIHTDQNQWQSKLLFSTPAKISTFGVDEAGELYLADLGTGSILRLSQNP